MQPSRVIPDSLGLNGLKARITILTHPRLAESKGCDFNGRANWLGVTCDTTYELNGAGPFVHRRIIFKSTLPWESGVINAGVDNPSGGLRACEYIRKIATGLSDGKLVGCLRRLFSQDTVRGVVQGPISSLGVTVLKDESFEMKGVEDGVRRHKKYWNSLKGEPVMQYDISPDASFALSLANAPASQHVYLVDIFSYGLGGLEKALPNPSTTAFTAGSGDAQMPSKKRVKSEDSVMSGSSNDSFGTGSLRESLLDPMTEDLEGGVANVTTVMKLYFRNG